MRMFIKTILGATALAAGICGVPAIAADYPDHPVKVIIPNAPGGGADIGGRLLQKPLEKLLKVPLAVTNVVGGGTSIGVRQAKESKPDGYTMLEIHQAMFVAAATGVMDFGPEALEPIAQTGVEYNCLVVNGKSSIQTAKDFVAAAKATPGSLKAGVQIGALNHFNVISLGEATGTEFRLVNTGGGAPTRTQLMGGHIDFTITSLSELVEYMKSGDLRILTCFSPKAPPRFPQLKTGHDVGIPLELPVSFRWYMPKGTPADRVKRMADAFEAAMKDPELLSQYNERQIEPVFLRGAELKAAIDREYAAMVKIVDKYDMKKKK